MKLHSPTPLALAIAAACLQLAQTSASAQTPGYIDSHEGNPLIWTPMVVSNNGRVVGFPHGDLLDLSSGILTSTGVYPFALSDDGSVVLTQDWGENQAALWSAGTGLTLLGVLPGYVGSEVRSNGLSADGTVVAGHNAERPYTRPGEFGLSQAFRWTQATGMVGLGHLEGGNQSWTHALSADGSTVVGGATTSGDYRRAFRWTQPTGMQSLGILPGGSWSEAHAVSANGSVVAGLANTATPGGNVVFRWTQSTGLLNLGNNLGAWIVHLMMSRSGDEIAGSGFNSAGISTGFYWTEASGMVDMMDANATALGIQSISPNRMSANGQVVVGQSNIGPQALAFRYTLAGGFQTVEQWLADSGVTIAGSIKPSAALGVSEDGSVVVGEASDGHTFRGFIARGLGTAAPVCSGCFGIIDVDSYNRTLQGVAHVPVQVVGEADIVLHGLHGSPMQGRPQTGGRNMWVAGDLGRQTRVGHSGDVAAGQVGASWGWAPGVTLKLALGRTYSNQNLAYNGKVTHRGTYIVPELIADLPNSAFTVSTSLYFNQGQADIRRAYENAGTVVAATGSPKTKTQGVRVRLDWRDAISNGAVRISPYVSATHYKTKVDGYTEEGGGFPVQWHARSQKNTLLRLGADAAHALNEQWTLMGRLEGVQRVERRSVNATGQVLGLNAFDIQGLTYKRHWARAAVGVEGKVGKGALTLMLNASTETNGPAHWLNASYRVAF